MAKAKKRKTCYYAHGMYLYGSEQEKRDIKLLKWLDFNVIDPGTRAHQRKAEARGNKMEYFISLAVNSDIVAFRATPSGRMTSGVGKEVSEARRCNIPIIELPRLICRTMLIDETVEFLEQVGER